MENAEIYLTVAAFVQSLSGIDIFEKDKKLPNYFFAINDKDTAQIWQGIMPDSGASNLSTGGKAQYFALKN